MGENSVRDLLRGGSRPTREAFARTGDAVLVALTAYPFLVDSLIDSGLSSHDWTQATQFSLIAGQSFLMTLLLRSLSKVAIGRDRPFQQECGANPSYDSECNTPESRNSFFSGHAAFAFTGAGLICSAHEKGVLAGGSAPCYVSLGLATFVALTRVIADKHYLSDTVVGAGIGLVSGYLIPRWINYGSSSSNQALSITPMVAREGMKLYLAFPL